MLDPISMLGLVQGGCLFKELERQIIFLQMCTLKSMGISDLGSYLWPLSVLIHVAVLKQGSYFRLIVGRKLISY